MRPRAATKGFQSIAESSVSPPRETEGGFFVSTRRAFLVGAGSALTLPIVSKFESFKWSIQACTQNASRQPDE